MDWIQNSKKDGDHDKMKYYAEDIQKFFERQLRLPVSTFSDIIKENNLDSARQNREGSATTNEL
jgi:hypothetical protein